LPESNASKGGTAYFPGRHCRRIFVTRSEEGVLLPFCLWTPPKMDSLDSTPSNATRRWMTNDGLHHDVLASIVSALLGESFPTVHIRYYFVSISKTSDFVTESVPCPSYRYSLGSRICCIRLYIHTYLVHVVNGTETPTHLSAAVNEPTGWSSR